MKQTSKYRLADCVYVEPTVNTWPAWPGILAPLPASLNLANYQVPLMTSYLANPTAHVDAARDPALAGGRFMDVPVERQGDIQQLLNVTQVRQRGSIEVAREFLDFVRRIAVDGDGRDLSSSYERIPTSLRGCLELVYDYFNHANVRVIEELLYETSLYDTSLQSLSVARLDADWQRPFLVSTPRIADPDVIDWPVPFVSSTIDDLFRLDIEPQPLDRILATLSGASVTADALRPFLSTDPQPRKVEVWPRDTVRIRYFGHACVLVEWYGVSILTDAYVPVRPARGGSERLSFADLPTRIDFVIITHNHHDHYSVETLLRLRHRIGCLVVPPAHGVLYGDTSLRLLSRKLGFADVRELRPLESLPFDGGEIIGVPFLGEHADLALGKIGYVVRCGGEQMLFGADSDCLDRAVYDRVRRALGCIHSVFLAIEPEGAPLSWVNGPLLPHPPSPEIDRQRRYHACDVARALNLTEAVEAERAFVYAMGIEPWTERLLGSLTTPGTPRWEESNRFLARAYGRGLRWAERLVGPSTMYLRSPLQTDPAARPHAEDRARFWAQRFEGCVHASAPFVPTDMSAAVKSPEAVTINLPETLNVAANVENDASRAALLATAMLAALAQMSTTEGYLVAFNVRCCAVRSSESFSTGASMVLPVQVDTSDDPTLGQLRARVLRGLEQAETHALAASDMSTLVQRVFGHRPPGRWRLGVTMGAADISPLTQLSVATNGGRLCDIEIVSCAERDAWRVHLVFDRESCPEDLATDLARAVHLALAALGCSASSTLSAFGQFAQSDHDGVVVDHELFHF